MSFQSSSLQQLFLFRSQISNRRLDDNTIRILESALASKDVKSLLEVRSTVKELLRRESLHIIREAAQKSFDEKLLIVEFLVRAFALIGDVESCLALRYEAFIMRDQNAVIDERLKVSHNEWLVFARQCFDNGFHSIAHKACEKVLLCNPTNLVDPENDGFLHSNHVINEIKALKEAAMYLISSQSVQVFTAEYMKKRAVQQPTEHDPVCTVAPSSGSTLFRNGIKNHNLRKLHERRRAQQSTCNDMSFYFQVARIKQKRGYKDQRPWSIKLYTDEKGTNKGDEVLSYEDPSAAHSAGGVFDNYESRGYKVRVGMAETSAPKAGAPYGSGGCGRDGYGGDRRRDSYRDGGGSGPDRNYHGGNRSRPY